MKMDHRDVQLAYFKDGPDAVLSLIEKKEVSRYTVRRALRGIREENGDSGYERLVSLLAERGISINARPSKSKPDAGDVRTYLVQKAKGSLFIRLPVWHLDVEAGDAVTARFFVGSVKVEPGSVNEDG